MGKSNLQKQFPTPTQPTLTMVFSKYVEIGRICFVPSNKQIYTIVDVIDSRHVIIDSPKKDSRTKINLNNIQLTKFKLEFLHGARTATVKAAGLPPASTPSGPRPDGPRTSRRRRSVPTSATLTDLSSKLKQAKRQIVNSQLK